MKRTPILMTALLTILSTSAVAQQSTSGTGTGTGATTGSGANAGADVGTGTQSGMDSGANTDVQGGAGAGTRTGAGMGNQSGTFGDSDDNRNESRTGTSGGSGTTGTGNTGAGATGAGTTGTGTSGTRATGTNTGSDRDNESFDVYDTNRDGSLDQNELREGGMTRQGRTMDSDRSDSVEREEYYRYQGGQ